MPLSHVCVWDADIGYKRISLESACKMYPNGASAKSGYFVCELCAQNVLLTAPGVNVRHFRHDPSSPNKECDERQAHFDPLYGRRLRNLNSHLMPLRITVAKESFALQMGFFCPPDSGARCDKIRITTNSGKAYEYSFERIERGGTSRLRRLIGDSEHRFVNVFRETCGEDSRRPQFGMYTGRTPYAGKEPKRSADRSLVATYSEMLNAETDEEKAFLQKLIKDGKFPVKEDFHEFLRKLYDSNHIPDDEDAELVTRFEMQRFCPDILITNYSMLEYMLLRPIESKIWADTQNWLNADSNNKLLFVIDEAHMYRGSAGGEVSFLIRRLFHRLGIDRSRVQFILTTASMPNKNEEDRRVIQTFANDLTASDDGHEFHYLAGQQEEIGSGRAYDIPFDRFTKAHPESFEGDNAERLLALNKFWEGIIDSPAPFSTDNSAYQWLYDHLVDYVPFRELFKLCRGTTASLQELAQSIFPGAELEDAFHAVGVMLAIAPLARSGSGSVLFPARMHMLFRGIKGVYACTNPECSCAHTENGLTLGEVYFTDGNLTCKKCGSTVYELYNDRRCGSIFFRGFVLKQDFDDRKRTYLWHYPGMMNENEVQEIHLFVPSADYQLPEKQGKNKIQPCYLDVCSGFVDFSDDSLDGSPGIRKLYYGEFTTKARPDILTFSTCPHCRHELGKRQLTSFSILPLFDVC